jgi:hypothetical protein
MRKFTDCVPRTQRALLFLLISLVACSGETTTYSSNRGRPVQGSDDALKPKNIPATGAGTRSEDAVGAVESGSGSGVGSTEDGVSDQGETPVVAEKEDIEEATASVRKLTELDALAGLPTGVDQLKVLCARQGQDRLRTALCGSNPPSIKGLADLQAALGLAFDGQNNPQFALTGHSSSLVARHVTSINPRAVIFTPNAGNNTPNRNYVALGFTRGEQFVEIAANDPTVTDPAVRLKFFLIRFEQGCNSKEGGCSVGELLTPEVEKNWTGFTVYGDEDLKNTLFDCRHCHQPGGPTTPRILRMQELRNPWTHFFRNNTNGGRQLIAEFQAAHGNQETYAGIPGGQISSSDPADLEDLVRAAGFGNQPNEFPTRQIESNNNRQAWEGIYANFSAGGAIAVPYFGVSISDPVKLTAMSAEYGRYLRGEIAAVDLADIRDTLREEDRWAMGFAVRPDATDQQILLQACSQCHNSALDQSLSRARFNVDLTKVAKEEIEVAVQRIMLPPNDPARMPPARFRSLTEEEKSVLIQLLRSAKP